MSSIENRERMGQLLDFDGLEWGLCRCTDIDLSVDWQGRTFVFVEVKSGDAPLTKGQKIHLQGLVKGLRAGGKTAYAILARHHTPVGEDVIVKDCQIESLYDGYCWLQYPENGDTVETLMNKLYREHRAR